MKYIKTIIILAFILIFSESIFARQSLFCATDQTPQIVDENSLFKRPANMIIKIPVLYHVNDQNPTNFDVMLEDNIDVLNTSFAGSNFTFELFGINHFDNNNWDNITIPSGSEPSAFIDMKNELSKYPEYILNVYVTGITNAAGYATFPWDYSESNSLHGIVIDPGYITNGGETNFDSGEVLTHEVGHYLGVYHTFQGGCNGDGDKVDDTPYHLEPATAADYFCSTTRNSCTSKPGNDPQNNFMNYVTTDCMTEFTDGQIERMETITNEHKPSLGEIIEFTSNANLTQNITITTFVSIEDNVAVTIEANIEFLNATILLGENSTIIVDNGGKLISNNSLFSRLDPDKEHDGIYLKTTDNEINDTKISGGYFGLQIRNQGSGTTTHYINDSDIEDNVYGIFTAGSIPMETLR